MNDSVLLLVLNKKVILEIKFENENVYRNYIYDLP